MPACDRPLMPEQTPDAAAPPPDQAARDRIEQRARGHALRRSRSGVGEDVGLGPAGPGAGAGRARRTSPGGGHHLHRKGGGRAARSDQGRTGEGGRSGSRRRPRRARPGGPRPARRRSHRHAPLVRPAPALRAPGRGRAPAAGRGARRGQLVGGLRRALVVLSRPAPGRPRTRAHRAAAVRLGREAQSPALAGRGLRRQLGPRATSGCPRQRPTHRRCTSSLRPPPRPSGASAPTPCHDPSDKLRERLDEIARANGGAWLPSRTSSTSSRLSVRRPIPSCPASGSGVSGRRPPGTATWPS